MIDTIKLSLGKGMFWVEDLTKFQKDTMNASRGFFKLVQNPTPSELKNGIYKPRLTLAKRANYSGRFEPTLYIELSLPKLWFGNNFDELTNDNFKPICNVLQKHLSDMGIRVFFELLENAPASSIHYSKNIPLTDGTTPHYLISKIKQANIRLSLDVNQTDYRNDGHNYKWHANTYEVAFYDKIKDLQTSKISDKRAIEKDNKIQLSLFDKLEKRNRLEILRFEVRLNTRQKLRQLFKKLDIEQDLTFKNLFSQNIAQKVLIYYLDEIESQRLPLFDFQPKDDKDLLAEIVINNPGITPLDAAKIVGLKKFFEIMTPRELRAMFSDYSSRSWYRLMADARSIKLPKRPSPLSIVRKQIEEFVTFRLVDFQELMLNNDKQ